MYLYFVYAQVEGRLHRVGKIEKEQLLDKKEQIELARQMFALDHPVVRPPEEQYEIPPDDFTKH